MRALHWKLLACVAVVAITVLVFVFSESSKAPLTLPSPPASVALKTPRPEPQPIAFDVTLDELHFGRVSLAKGEEQIRGKVDELIYLHVTCQIEPGFHTFSTHKTAPGMGDYNRFKLEAVSNMRVDGEITSLGEAHLDPMWKTLGVDLDVYEHKVEYVVPIRLTADGAGNTQLKSFIRFRNERACWSHMEIDFPLTYSITR